MSYRQPITRSNFLKQATSLLGVAFLGRGGLPRLSLAPLNLTHPEPREGITAERVLAESALSGRKEPVLRAYESARSYPAIFDGIACGCSCGGEKGTHRSLLVCYETQQPTGCGACQEEAHLVGRLAKAEKSLAEIREAVDKEYR
jgi:hypothetical protein